MPQSVLASIRTYRLFHVEDSSEYLVYGYADTNSSGHWPQSLWASELGNLWRDQRPGYETGKEYILGKATVKKKQALKSLAWCMAVISVLGSRGRGYTYIPR